MNHCPKQNKILYWILTLLFLVPTAGIGIPEVLTDGPEVAVSLMKHLGYPLYLMKILGFAKILGAIAIISGKYPRLKEWAYAGFTFDFLGAIASHWFVGDRIEILAPLSMLILMAGSYVCWKRGEGMTRVAF